MPLDSHSGSQDIEQNEKPDAFEPINTVISANMAKLKDSTDQAEFEKALGTLRAAVEIEKTHAEASKAQADTAKVVIDSTLARRQMRIALLNSMFAPLVPLASLLTVIVTLLVAREQTRSADQLAAQKSEETTWTTFQNEIDKSSPDALLSTATFLSKLRRISATGKYTKEISDIQFQLMIGASSDSAFKQLWRLRFTGTDDDNITQVIELARAKKQQYDRLTIDCKQTKVAETLPEDKTWTYLGVCSPKYGIDDLTKAIPDPASLKAATNLKASVMDINSIVAFLSVEIGKYLKTAADKKSALKPIDISGIVLHNMDLEGVDLSQANLTQAVISSSRPRGAT